MPRLFTLCNNTAPNESQLFHKFTDAGNSGIKSHLKDADISYCEFRRSLKTFLFG